MLIFRRELFFSFSFFYCSSTSLQSTLKSKPHVTFLLPLEVTLVTRLHSAQIRAQSWWVPFQSVAFPTKTPYTYIKPREPLVPFCSTLSVQISPDIHHTVSPSESCKDVSALEVRLVPNAISAPFYKFRLVFRREDFLLHNSRYPFVEHFINYINLYQSVTVPWVISKDGAWRGLYWSFQDGGSGQILNQTMAALFTSLRSPSMCCEICPMFALCHKKPRFETYLAGGSRRAFYSAQYARSQTSREASIERYIIVARSFLTASSLINRDFPGKILNVSLGRKSNIE